MGGGLSTGRSGVVGFGGRTSSFSLNRSQPAMAKDMSSEQAALYMHC